MLKRICKKILTLYATQKLRVLSKSEGVTAITARSIHKALTESAPYTCGIELIRRSLLKDKTEVVITEHGAGSKLINAAPNKNRMVCDIVRASISPLKGRILYNLVRGFNPTSCLELGTSIGISTAYIATALEINNTLGRIRTIEGSEELSALAEKHINQLGFQRRCTFLTGTFNKLIPASPLLDFVFIDGDHTEQATIYHYQNILPYLADRAVVVFDDIRWSSGMVSAWERITNHAAVKTVFDLRIMGVCIIDRLASGKRVYRIPIY